MKMVSVRELRGETSRIWKELSREKEIVITSSGKPIALLMPTSEDVLEETLKTLRRARVQSALLHVQLESAKSGRASMPLEEINREIQTVRKKRTR